MESSLNQIFANGTSFCLYGFLTAALFFGAAACREMRNENVYAFVYVFLSAFFLISHFYLMYNLPIGYANMIAGDGLNLFGWLAGFVAPAAIALLLSLGLVRLIMSHIRLGLVNLFIGLTLVCYLFMIGTNWPVDVKGIITIVYCLMLLQVEFEAADAFG